jgi:hypothetical protein
MFTLRNFFAVLILLFHTHQIFSQGLNFEFLKISNIRNGYTLQSNGSPQQLWIDPKNPEYLHVVFINSQFKTVWPDRTCLYFGSSDFGQSWFELGSVPDTSRSGFPAIHGTTDGAAIITNHSNYFGSPTRTGLFIDESPFQYDFSAYDPGIQPPTGWPRCINTPFEKILIAATALQSGDNIAFNTFDIPSKTFSGWILFPGIGSETSSLSVSDAGKIGFAFIADEISDAGDIFYSESSDAGITWMPPIKVFDCPAEQGIAVGALRGIGLNFSGESPCVVFETCQQDFSQFGGGYFPRLPNQILFWSPNINGGVAKVIADSNNVPFAPSINPQDIFSPLCRPVIGRAEDGFLFVAFSAATENVCIAADTTTYFAGYFMYSMNGGNSWLGGPQKFTPDFPLLDWKYISIAPVNPWLGDQLYVHLVLQGDSLEAVPDPQLLSAQYYHSMAWIMSVGVEDDLISERDFHLYQNYPNPFNPSTKIKYQIPVGGFVNLKVYDVLGNEVAILVNEEKTAGSYEIEFSAVGLPSGIYFYTLKAANYIQTHKMILLK